MHANVEEPYVEDSGAYSRRCLKICGILSVVLSTLFFFGGISVIIWLFEYNHPMKFSVVCFMVASGLLYLVSFTSSLLLITRKKPRVKVNRMNSNETATTGCTNQEGVPDSYDMAANISYTGEPNLLHVPPKAIVRITPPPPYEGNGTTRDHSISEYESSEDQSNSEYIRMTANRVYYDLKRHESDPRLKCGSQSHIKSAMNVTETSFIVNSKPQTSAKVQFQLKPQEAAIDVPQEYLNAHHRCLPQAPIYVERSPRQTRAELMNPSTALKRKLKTSLSKSDLDSEIGTGPLSSHSNAGSLEPHSNFKSDGSLITSPYNSEIESLGNSSAASTPRFLRRCDMRSSQLNQRPPMVQQISQSNLYTENSMRNSNVEDKAISNMNSRQQFGTAQNGQALHPEKRSASHSNLNFSGNDERLKSETSVTSDDRTRTNSASLASSRSNISDSTNLPTTSQVQNLKKIFQPEKFVASSKDVPTIQKARSHGSLLDEVPESPQVSRRHLKTIGETSTLGDDAKRLSANGRSTESVLDASRNRKQLTLEEWMSAWNHGIRRIPTVDGERIVGVRL